MKRIQTFRLASRGRNRKPSRLGRMDRRNSTDGQSINHTAFHKDVSVIFPARNEAHVIAPLVRRLRQWSAVREVIVVANGCSDQTAQRARLAGARILEFAHPLGHDCGRAIGAAVAKGKILLFLDADISWQVDELRAYVRRVRQGADIALNAYPSPHSPLYHHPTAVAKRTLNLVCGRPDLGAASLTAVPHAMRRSALTVVGIPNLAIPPLAQAKALTRDLRVVTATWINLYRRNRRQPMATTRETAHLILGDHVEALAWVMGQQDSPRGGFSDWRKRDMLEESPNPKDPTEAGVQTLPWEDTSSSTPLAAVVPACNEAASLPRVLTELQKLGVAPLMVISNGSEDETVQVAESFGAKVVLYKTPLGHDVPRALGAQILRQGNPFPPGDETSTPACTLFVDGDFSIPAADLRVMTRSVLEEGVDVALNNLSGQHRDPVSTMKAFLNLTLGRPDLGSASLTAVPHALSQRALDCLPIEDLAVPPKALVRAVALGLQVRAVHRVDVVSPNRFRPRWHSRRYGAPLTRMIVGDHLEALALWIQLKGPRGGFLQNRKLDEMNAFLNHSSSMRQSKQVSPTIQQEVNQS